MISTFTPEAGLCSNTLAKNFDTGSVSFFEGHPGARVCANENASRRDDGARGDDGAAPTWKWVPSRRETPPRCSAPRLGTHFGHVSVVRYLERRARNTPRCMDKARRTDVRQTRSLRCDDFDACRIVYLYRFPSFCPGHICYAVVCQTDFVRVHRAWYRIAMADRNCLQ